MKQKDQIRRLMNANLFEDQPQFDDDGPIDPLFARIHQIFMSTPHKRFETKFGIIEVWDDNITKS